MHPLRRRGTAQRTPQPLGEKGSSRVVQRDIALRTLQCYKRFYRHRNKTRSAPDPSSAAGPVGRGVPHRLPASVFILRPLLPKVWMHNLEASTVQRTARTPPAAGGPGVERTAERSRAVLRGTRQHQKHKAARTRHMQAGGARQRAQRCIESLDQYQTLSTQRAMRTRHLQRAGWAGRRSQRRVRASRLAGALRLPQPEDGVLQCRLLRRLLRLQRLARLQGLESPKGKSISETKGKTLCGSG